MRISVRRHATKYSVPLSPDQTECNVLVLCRTVNCTVADMLYCCLLLSAVRNVLKRLSTVLANLAYNQRCSQSTSQ